MSCCEQFRGAFPPRRRRASIGHTAAVGILGLPRAADLILCLVLPTLCVAAEPRRLTRDGQLKQDPVFISQGEEVIYTVQEDINLLSLMRLRLADGVVERFRPEATTSEFGISFSANEDHYAFIQNNGNLHVKVVISDLTQGSEAAHDPGGGFAGVRSLSVAPDASRVVFAFPERGVDQQLHTLSMDATKRTSLTDSKGFHVWPRFSPDGRWLAFASTAAGNFDIWIMSSMVGTSYQVTEFEGLDTRPAWSPDGKQLAFTSLRDGNYDIYTMSTAGGSLRRITRHAEIDDFACWHPDGQHILTVSQRDGKQDLYLFDVPTE